MDNFDRFDDLIGEPKTSPKIKTLAKALDSEDPKRRIEKLFSLEMQAEVFGELVEGIRNGSGSAKAAMMKIYKDSIPLYFQQQGIIEEVTWGAVMTDSTEEQAE